MTLECTALLALVDALVTLEPLHVDAVDVRFVAFEVAALLALVFTLIAIEPLHVDAVDVRFVNLEVAVLLALVLTLIAIEPLHVDAVDIRFVLPEGAVHSTGGAAQDCGYFRLLLTEVRIALNRFLYSYRFCKTLPQEAALARRIPPMGYY